MHENSSYFFNEKLCNSEQASSLSRKMMRTVLTFDDGREAIKAISNRVKVFKSTRDRKIHLIKKELDNNELWVFNISSYEHYRSLLRWHLKNLNFGINHTTFEEGSQSQDYNRLFTFFTKKERRKEFFLNGNFLLFKFISNMLYLNSLMLHGPDSMQTYESYCPYDNLEVRNMMNPSVIFNESKSTYMDIMLTPWNALSSFNDSLQKTYKYPNGRTLYLVPYVWIRTEFEKLMFKLIQILEGRSFELNSYRLWAPYMSEKVDIKKELGFDPIVIRKKTYMNIEEENASILDMGTAIEVLTRAMITKDEVVEVITNRNNMNSRLRARNLRLYSSVLDCLLTSLKIGTDGEIKIVYNEPLLELMKFDLENRKRFF